MGRSEGNEPSGPDGPFAAVPTHDAVVGLDLIAQGVALLQGAGAVTLSAAELRALVEAAARSRASLEAGYLHVLAALDDRDGAVARASAGKTGATFLVHRLQYSPGAAAVDVAAARALDTASGRPDVVPQLAAALAAGEISRAHVDVAVRCIGRIPAHLLDRVDEHGTSGRTAVDAFLTQHSREQSPTTTDRLAKQVLATLDPDGQDRFDPVSYTRRTLTMVTDSTGMTVVRALLDPIAGALLRAALEKYAHDTADDTADDRADDTANEQDALFADDRTPGQRRVDSLSAVCRAALNAVYPSWEDGGPGRQPAPPAARVIITATPEQAAEARRASPAAWDDDGVPMRPPEDVGAAGLATHTGSGDPLPPGVLGRFLCDAELQTVVLSRDRAVLDLGRSTRLATKAQRTALVARDRGCIAPGCTAPPSACEAHHAVWWRHGGATSIDNLALVCGRHHTLIHTGLWALQMRDGVPFVVAPSWVDPTRTPRRNSVFAAEADARRLGQALRAGVQLDLGIPPDAPDPPDGSER